MPKGERDLTDEEQAAFAKPWRRRRERWRLKYLLEKSLLPRALYRPGTKMNAAREQFCRDYIARQFADHPELREAVTPDVPVSRQAAGLRQHLLSRPQEGERRARPPGRGLGDPDRHRRQRRGRAGRRRDRHGHRLQAGRTTSPACRVVGPRRPHPAGDLGGRAARAYLGITVPGVPQLLHALRAGHQRRRDRDHAREPGGVRRAGDEAHDAGAGHRRRGQGPASRPGGTAGSRRAWRAPPGP